MPIGTAPRFWTWGCHRFEKLPYGCRDLTISMCLAPNMFLRHRESVVETGQMSSVETRQMSQQQSSVLSQQQTSVLSQQKTSSLSQHHIVCVSETGQGPDTCNRDGSRQPYSNFSNRPHPPRQNRGAVLMGIAVWRVTEKPKKNGNGVNVR